VSARVLVVDDDHALLEALPPTISLRMADVEVETCDSGARAIELIDEIDYDAVVSDIKMPGMDGLALLGEVHRRRPRTPTLLITGHGDRELAVEALRGGAYDFIQKPIDRDYFAISLARAIEMRRLDREAERQRQALERHARVLEHIGDGVFLVAGDGTIQLWNRAAEAITGLPADHAIGRPPEEIFGRWSELSTLIPVSREPGSAAASPQTVPVEADGHETWISASGVAFDDGIVYAFRSLTAERALDELRDDFVATVSHELRTPLAAIYGSAQTLRARRNELAAAEQEQLFDMIAAESERLARIVNEILLAGQLDSGRLTVDSRSVDPLEVAHAALERIGAQARGVTATLVTPDSLPPVRADAGRLAQVLDNLLDNAVKYSGESAEIELQLETAAQHVRFSVCDRGAGIPNDELRRIFTKFYRVDPQQTGGVSGTGLGLYICRELVHRMGGRIGVSSRLGRGSTFTLDLPVAAAEASREGQDFASAQLSPTPTSTASGGSRA
jgi:two-component system phosphate regulon sensor histidine kinase PhoR